MDSSNEAPGWPLKGQSVESEVDGQISAAARLCFHSWRELLRQRAIAQRALKRGRNVEKTLTMINMIDAELERRRQAKLGRFSTLAPDLGDRRNARNPDPTDPEQHELFDESTGAVEREDRMRWLTLVRDGLPTAARQQGWSIRHDHCFARILLDNALGRPWREVVAPPAWQNTPIDDLRQAIALGEGILNRSADIHALNQNSLRLRGKLKP